MSGGLILGALVAVHLAVLVAGFTGARARLQGGIGIIAANYGLRRLLFLDPALGGSLTLWLGFILLADLTLVLLLVISAVKPAGRPRLHAADVAVAALAGLTLVLALADTRLPAVVRLAHWKDEYLYLAVYALARLNGPAAVRPGALAALAVGAVTLALHQAVIGPLGIDIAWVRSGRSLLTDGGWDAVAGAHGLGNLEAGFLRPYGFFGNGTDFGVFLCLIGLWAVAARLPSGGVSLPALVRAMLRPVPLLCLLGILLSVVRFTWVVWAFGFLVFALMVARGGGERGLRLWGLGSLLAGAVLVFLVLAPVLGGSGSLAARAFVTGTLEGRWQDQATVLGAMAETPATLLLGEGFGGHGAAARKFLPPPAVPPVEPHSRLLDLVLDGGLGLMLLTLAPLVLAWRGGSGGDPQRAAMLAFVLALATAAALLGAKSMLLQTVTWGALGMAVARAPRGSVGRPPQWEVPACG